MTPSRSPHRARLALSALALAATIGAVRAQPLTHYVTGTQTGPAAATFFGYDVALTTPPTGPAILAIADPAFTTGTMVNIGQVQLFAWNSTAVAAPLRTVVGPTSGRYFGTAIATGADYDGDGVADFVVGAPDVAPTAAGALVAISGAATPPPGSPLPVVLAGVANDQNLGRGIAPFQRAGIPTFAVVGRNRLHYVTFNATTNTFTVVFTSAPIPFAGAPAVPSVPIVSLGAPPNFPFDELAVSTTNGVLVVSGLAAKTVTTITNTAPGFGAALAVPGDVTGNGRLDLLVGAPGAGTGQVFLYEGGTWALKQTWTGATSAGGFGSSLGSGDFDGDGAVDYVVGAPGAGTVSLVSGATNLVYLTSGPPAGRPITGFGGKVAGLGDVDGNGFADYVMSSPSTTLGVASQTLVASGGPIATSTNLGGGCTCTSAIPRLIVGFAARPRLGTALPLTLVDNTNPGAPAVLGIGTDPGAPGCLQVAATIFIPGTLSVAGSWTIPPVPIGTSPSLMGLVLRAQCLVAGQSCNAYSNTLEGRIGL